MQKLKLHEELGAIGVLSFVGHGEEKRFVVFVLETLVLEHPSIYGLPTRAVTCTIPRVCVAIITIIKQERCNI